MSYIRSRPKAEKLQCYIFKRIKKPASFVLVLINLFEEKLLLKDSKCLIKTY